MPPDIGDDDDASAKVSALMADWGRTDYLTCGGGETATELLGRSTLTELAVRSMYVVAYDMAIPLALAVGYWRTPNYVSAAAARAQLFTVAYLPTMRGAH